MHIEKKPFVPTENRQKEGGMLGNTAGDRN